MIGRRHDRTFVSGLASATLASVAFEAFGAFGLLPAEETAAPSAAEMAQAEAIEQEELAAIIAC